MSRPQAAGAAAGGGRAVFGSVAPKAGPSSDATNMHFLSPSSPDKHAAEESEGGVSPASPAGGRLSRDASDVATVRLSELTKTCGLLTLECDQLRDELLVKSQLAIVLANSAVASQAEAAHAKQDMSARIDLINSMQRELHQGKDETAALRQAVATLDQQLREHAVEADRSATAAASHAELVRLRDEKASLESQMADWKTKVKDALREQKKREQQLTSAEIELRTELKGTQEKLNEAQFQLTGLQAKQNKVRTSREVQTDPTGSMGSGAAHPQALSLSSTSAFTAQGGRARDGSPLGTPGGLLGAADIGSPNPNPSGGGGGAGSASWGVLQNAVAGQRRRGYSKELRSPSLQPMMLMPTAGSTARSPSNVQQPPPLPLQGLPTSTMSASMGGVRAEQGGALSSFAAMYECFPLPISLSEAAILGLDPRAATLSPMDGMGVGSGGGGGGRMSPAMAPDPSMGTSAGSCGGGAASASSAGLTLSLSAAASSDLPFIVAVHYASEQDGGWSVVTKHRVTVGMTTASLIEQCCEQCASRYNMTLLPDRMCIRLNHDKSKRKVTLSLPRKLHSFMYFKKCVLENTPIVLYLCPKDDLAEAVNDSMNYLLAGGAAAGGAT